MNTKDNTLLIDCGNTYFKWCFFDDVSKKSSSENDLTKLQSLHHADRSEIEAFKELIDSQSSRCDSVVMVSVLGEIFSAGAKLIAQDAGLNLLEIHSQEKLAGLRNGYTKPKKLGSDRLVAMVGAYELIDDSHACIVIDSGTATTIDAVDETGQHLGGVIFPGLELSLESLGSNTEQLPSLEATEQALESNGFAIDTTQAIASGCLLSLASAIDGICNKMQRQLETNSSQHSNDEKIEVKRILCGGGAKALIPHLENDYDYHENLIMLGLKKIKVTGTETASNND
ncbi:MAG: type III pantothenate kinase [Cocleimonas sp.]